jgi:hypothetical protein
MRRSVSFLATSLFAISCATPLAAQSGLQITYGAAGVQTLSYRGVMLADLGKNPSDAFHIWHMKMTDLSGKPANCAQCGWGEANSGKRWDAATRTWTYAFAWGSISARFEQVGDALNVTVTTVNQASSGLIFDGATIYPLVLNFPRLPDGFSSVTLSQWAFETIEPGVTTASYGSGEVVTVVADASKPLYSGFQPTGKGFAYAAAVSGTPPDGLASFQPHYDRTVKPGQTDTYTVSLRFAPSGTATTELAADAYRNWAKTWPPQLDWKDRRAIGTAYLASSPAAVNGNINQPGGYANNPRRYFRDSDAKDFDVNTAEGLAKFQSRVLKQAIANVVNAQRMHAQGVVTWDIEGEEYPQPTSYVCAPDQIAKLAPEMESIVSDKSSAFVGMKLDDAYFKTMTTAGLRVGVCIRPQRFTVKADVAAEQRYLPDAEITAELIGKMRFAHDRWGATLFYVDSTVEADGAVLDASIFAQVARAFPDSLIMPEESTPKYYAYTAPFLAFIDNGATGSDPAIRSYYPKAFNAILVNDVAAGALAANRVKLTQAVARGNILMAHVDYWQENDPVVVEIYGNAVTGKH